MKLTIITINYNNAEGLRKTLASVAAQTYLDFEHIIVDGGSMDGSVDVIREYESSLASCLSPLASNLKWISEKDTGIYNAMNKGTRMANGEYLLYLNSGDFLVNNVVLSNVFDYDLREDIVYGDLVLKNGCLAKAPLPSEVSFMSLNEKKIFHPSSFIRRDLMLKIGGYDEGIKVTADFAFFLIAICKYNCSLRKIEIPISCFELGGVSSNISPENLRKEGTYILDKYFPRFKNDIRQCYFYKEKFNLWPYRLIYKIERKLKKTFNKGRSCSFIL